MICHFTVSAICFTQAKTNTDRFRHTKCTDSVIHQTYLQIYIDLSTAINMRQKACRNTTVSLGTIKRKY